jgi:hypothetical protein
MLIFFFETIERELEKILTPPLYPPPLMGEGEGGDEKG